MGNRGLATRLSAFALGTGLVLLGREILVRLRERDLRGRVALVTGGSRGLGYLLARELGREGCRVAICARNKEELRRARLDLEREGIEAVAQPCDVSARGQVQGMIEAVEFRFGPIDILVNNAGIIQVGPMQTMTLEDYEEAMGVMFWGTVYPTLAVLPGMRKRGAGHIVNITSIGGKVSAPRLLPYSCAKFAAVGFSEGLHAELAGQGVHVTTIVPGFMRTGSHLNAGFKGEEQYGWFALAAALPGISMDAERAAAQIVQAIKRREAERILSVPANVMARFQGLFPGANASILSLVNRYVLAGASHGQTETATGMQIQERMGSSLLDAATEWGLAAGRRFHQYSGVGSPNPSPTTRDC
jgi:short-subunit dehydrogenase